jgi:hypothetical protein
MNELISQNLPQFHPMHRQLLDTGGIRKKIPNNKNLESWSTKNQLKLPKTKLPKATLQITIAPTVKRQPHQNDVICARGRTYWDHPGNRLYRKLISLAKNQYSKAPNRLSKSLIVTEIISHIHDANGHFVKKTNRNGEDRWIECNLNFVREKVTQSLRDGLSFKYSSSTTRKRERKAQVQESFHSDIDRIVRSNAAVSQIIKDLKEKVELTNQTEWTESEVSDEKIMKLFDSANLNILETMKKDRSLVDQLHTLKTTETVPGSNDQDFRPTSLSSTTMDSTISPPILLSQSRLSNTTSNAYSTSQVTPLPAILINQYESINKQENSCDDMDLDLESPFMFLDDFTSSRF